MTQAKQKFDRTISRCREQINLYNDLKEMKEKNLGLNINVSQDILRGLLF